MVREYFLDHFRNITTFLQCILKKVSIKLSKDPTERTWIRIDPCIASRYELQELKPVLKKEYLKATISCLYNIPMNAIDDKNVHMYNSGDTKVKKREEKIRKKISPNDSSLIEK